jgi:hypothetical protein
VIREAPTASAQEEGSGGSEEGSGGSEEGSGGSEEGSGGSEDTTTVLLTPRLNTVHTV